MNDNAVLQLRLNSSKPIRVLIADPEEELQPVYREPLAQAGFDVATVGSGLACVARLRERVPDVLVIEPHLPWGGGDGVLAMMGEDPQLAAIPVMVLTSHRESDALSRVAKFPVSSFHLKPLAPDRLAAKLRTLAAHPRQRFGLSEQTGPLESAIAKRTGGRVQNLRVETVDGRIVVHGRSDSHHVRQLALVAIREAFEASRFQSERIEVNIEVG
ncbi:MAG: response regulator [Planctomycetaceae bacterium]|nr:response regulator [Planctomycetales bacterium]MCB9922411.1 response regulator [Planctomycetaceae bacterium]